VCDAARAILAPRANLPAAEHTRTKAPRRYQPLVCSRSRFPCVTLQRRHHVPLPVRALRHLAPAHTPYGSLQHTHGREARATRNPTPLRRVCDAAGIHWAPRANHSAAEHTRTKAPRRYQPLVCSRGRFPCITLQRPRPGSHTLRVWDASGKDPSANEFLFPDDGICQAFPLLATGRSIVASPWIFLPYLDLSWLCGAIVVLAIPRASSYEKCGTAWLIPGNCLGPKTIPRALHKLLNDITASKESGW